MNGLKDLHNSNPGALQCCVTLFSWYYRLKQNDSAFSSIVSAMPLSGNETLAGLNLTGPLGEDLLQIYQCTLNEDLARQNLAFCQDFLTNQMLGRSLHVKVPLVLLFCLLFTVGFIGNCLVILSVALFPAMRSRTNLFLLNLAVSDVLVFVVCLPLTAYSIVNSRWIFGAALCKLAPFVQGVSVSVSICSLASMSIKRYVLIRFPMTAKGALTNRAMCLWLAGIWLLSMLLCSPTPMAYVQKEQKVFWLLTVHSCVEDWQASQSRRTGYTLFLLFALYVIPLSAMTVFYCKLGRSLVVSTARLAEGSAAATTNQRSARAARQSRIRASRMMVALLLAFAICWLPYHIVNLLIDLRYPGKQPDLIDSTGVANGTSAAAAAAGAVNNPNDGDGLLVTALLPLTTLLGFANSAINPICLVLVSSKFKTYFRLIVTLRCSDDDQSTRARAERAQLYSLHSRTHPASLRSREAGSPTAVKPTVATVALVAATVYEEPAGQDEELHAERILLGRESDDEE